jgi:pimeloyl-ACP methyl ester carboxylesterase
MRSLVLALLLMSATALANPLFTDPPATATRRARMEVLHIPSGGVEINGVAYLAAGPGPHPTIVICHGWPGNEKNLDLAQALRRAGWNAITFNYRGAWGSPGAFRFGQNPEDAKAVLAMLRKPEVAAKLGIDTRRIVLAGHSMGGWVTGMVASEDQALAGAILISAANMGMAAQMAGDRLEAQAAGNSEGLAGTSPALQAAELRAQAVAFDLRPRAAGLARQRPKPLGLRDLQPAILGLPVVDRRFRNAVSPGQIGRLRARLGLLQNPDDLLFGEPRSLHRPSSPRAGL